MDEVMTLEERLNEELGQKELEVERLQSKIEMLEHQDEWKWRQIKQLSEEENLGLPVPRMEIRYRAIDEFNLSADYGLVYEHLLGDIVFVPFGSTKIGSHKYLEHLQEPFRDGAHIRNEMYLLKLPGFIVGGGRYKEISLDNKEELSSALLMKMDKNG